MLRAAGISEMEERAYLLLLDRTSASLRQLADRLGISTQRVGRLVAALEAKGLAHRTPPPDERVLVVPPEIAVDQLLVRRQDELESVREAVRLLVTERGGGRGRRVEELIEIVRGRATVRDTLVRLQRGARQEVMALMAAPFLVGTPLQVAEERMRDGVVYRVAYAEEVVGSGMVPLMESGEQARVVPLVPTKLVLVDRSVAMLPLASPIQTTDWASVLVHQSGLLDALIALFEAVWDRAVPLSPPSDDGWDGTPSITDRRVLTMLVQGLTDEAVATRLGLSRRTVVRRVAHLMALVGARSRLQLGWLAKERGWLDAQR